MKKKTKGRKDEAEKKSSEQSKVQIIKWTTKAWIFNFYFNVVYEKESVTPSFSSVFCHLFY